MNFKPLIFLPIFAILITTLAYGISELNKLGAGHGLSAGSNVNFEKNQTKSQGINLNITYARINFFNSSLSDNKGTFNNYSNIILILAITSLAVFGIIVLFYNLTSGYPSFKFRLKKTYSKDKIEEFREIITSSISSVRDYQFNLNDIIELYKQICSFLEKHGVQNAPSLTAREFEENVFKLTGFKSDSFHNLTLLFEEARYSTHPIDEEKVNLARELVKKILKEINEKL